MLTRGGQNSKEGRISEGREVCLYMRERDELEDNTFLSFFPIAIIAYIQCLPPGARTSLALKQKNKHQGCKDLGTKKQIHKLKSCAMTSEYYIWVITMEVLWQNQESSAKNYPETSFNGCRRTWGESLKRYINEECIIWKTSQHGPIKETSELSLECSVSAELMVR